MRACYALVKHQRCFSSNIQYSSMLQSYHPAVRGLTSELLKVQPCFPISPNDVRILFKPKEFLVLLIKMIERAQKRIFLSSLYIGSEEQYLINAIENALASNPRLQVYIHLDYNRSTRPGPESTAQMLLSLIKTYPERVHPSFFKSPKLKGVMGKLVPRRFDEGWGTWHAKIYGVDDEVMISGANLNESYFTNRQDRYLHFTSPQISQYCFGFLQTMSNFCYRLKPPESGAGSKLPYTLQWANPYTQPEKIEPEAGAALEQYQQDQMDASSREHLTISSHSQVLIFPIIQGGQFSVREEERCLRLLFNDLNLYASSGGKPLIDLTSGYFGLYKPYQQLVQESKVDCRIIAASPKANGFYGSKGISGRIPEGYTLLEQRFWAGIKKSNREWGEETRTGVQLHEWYREGWTYHAKGIWVRPSHDEQPILSLFGSTNLNSRSANLDTELAFVMVVPTNEEAKPLREQLAEEVEKLEDNAIPWKGRERKVRLGTKAIVGLVGGML